MKPKELIENCRRMVAEIDSNTDLMITNNWNYSFMKSMIERYEKNKTLTNPMRKIILEKIEKGLNPPPENDLISKYEKEKHLKDYMTPQQAEIFEDIWKKKKKYSSISQKQEEFLSSLKNSAKKNMERGPWNPNEEDMKEISLALEIAQCYRATFWENHPTSNQKYNACARFYRSVSSGKNDNIWYSQEDFRKFCDVIRTKLKAVKEPEHKLSDIRYVWHESFPGIVVSEPYIHYQGGHYTIVQELLINGKVRIFPVDSIKKRKKKV